MADMKLYVVSALCLVLFGALPCQSQVCSKKSISDCHSGFNNDFCEYYADVTSCLEEVESACTDDVLLVELKDTLASRRALSSACPGMTANCVWDAMMVCEREVPINVKTLINMRLSDKMKDCKEFKGKDVGIKQCFNDIKTNCTSPAVDRHVDSNIQTVVDIVNICADLE